MCQKKTRKRRDLVLNVLDEYNKLDEHQQENQLLQFMEKIGSNVDDDEIGSEIGTGTENSEKENSEQENANKTINNFDEMLEIF